MNSIDTARSADGRSFPALRPGAALAGSPLSLSGTTPGSVGPPEGEGAVVVYASEAAHLSFSGAATADDIPLPAGQWVTLPVRTGTTFSFRLVGAPSGTVWVHEAARVGAS